MNLKLRRSAADAGPELEQGCLLYLGITGYKDWRRAVCYCWLSKKVLGGAGQVSGVGHFETECWDDVQHRLHEMWMCGGGEEQGITKNV